MFWFAFVMLLLTCLTIVTLISGFVCIMDAHDRAEFAVACVLIIVACAGGAGLITLSENYDDKPVLAESQ